jgi:uncharacterized membrane protein YidH (DUF202 family)
MWQRLKERLKGYRTVIFGASLTIAMGALEILQLMQAIDLHQFLSPRHATIGGLAIGIIVVWLRLITTGPVGEKGYDRDAD